MPESLSQLVVWIQDWCGHPENDHEILLGDVAVGTGHGAELITWTQLLLLDGHLATAEPKKLR